MTPLLVFLILGTICGGEALYFEDNYDHHYTYSSVSDILGLHNVTTIIKFRIRSVNDTNGGMSLHLLMVDSFVQISEKGYVADNPEQWKFTHKFFFTVGKDGVVTFVHFHPEEKNEVLTMKKVLASTLSVKQQVEDGYQWRYTSTEEDHSGHLEHEYEATRHSEGVTFVRKHQSSKDVHRLHNKTIHLDLKGTPVHVDSIDNITLRHTPSKVSSKTMDGFADIEDKHSGEFPKISSISRSNLKMISKRRHNEHTSHSVHDMQTDTLTIRQVPPEKVSLQKVKKEIQSHLACVHSFENKYDRNRTECVHSLRELIYSLKKDDFLKFGTKALTQTCEDNDILCKDERNLFIDILAHEGSVEAQLLVLDLVMRSPNVTEEDLRRCLIHAIAIKSPALEVVYHIEALCFGDLDDTKPGETPTLTKTRKRACLSLGAMAKSLHDKNITESDRIVEKFENWLDHHNQTKSINIVKPREKRSIIQHDMPARKHIETKMVLIQSLGNAGKSRSLQHIKSYMEPNVGVTAWRRAAIQSLRHFSCNESAHALLTSAVYDDDDLVRQTATNVLKKHPRRDNFTVEDENLVLSKNYSYPIVSRVRRGIMQVLEDGIKLYLKIPGIEWDKTLGTKDIGASFGLHIRNILDLKLALLSGHFKIDIHDAAYAEAHVGLINFEIDILRAGVCFKGHIAYDLNVLKDFGIDSLSDLVRIYDKILAKIVNPMTDAIKHFKEIIFLFRGRGLEQIVNSLVKVVKNLPIILGDVSQRLKEFVVEIFSIAGSTIVEEIKIIIQNVRNFVDGVKQNILKFYNDIVDAITLGLPYISKKIVEGFNLIISSLQQLVNNPMQSITSMSRAISSIKMAVTMAVDIKNKVNDACLFLKGRAVEWLNTVKQIPSIIKRLGEALKKLVKSIAGRKRRDLESEMTTTLSDGVGEMKSSLISLEKDLKAKWDRVLEPLNPLIHIVKPFVEEFKAIMDLIKGIKGAYKTVKETIETSKSLVQKVFGPKFHSKFPTGRRRAKGSCKEGVWPTTTQDAYQTTGVDLALGRGQSIVMPVNGILHVKSSEKRVLVQPIDPEFTALEIVIENIDPERKLDGKQVNAGERIGRASKGLKCDPNFIHVSVREARDETVPDADYDYSDPGPFLDRLVPVPKWIQECSDYEFKFLGQTIESGETDENEEPPPKEERIPREPSSFKELDGMLGDEKPQYRPDDPSLYDQTSFKDSLNKSFQEQARKFQNFFKIAQFGKGGPKIPNILDMFNVNTKNVRWVFENLHQGKQLYIDLNNLVDKLASSMIDVPVGNPATMSLAIVKKFMKLQGINSLVKGGDVSNVADSLMDTAGKVCPSFKGTIAAGFGHVCTVHECCLGITCSVPVPFGGKTKYLQISFDVKPRSSKILIKVNGTVFEITANEQDDEINTGMQVFEMEVYLVTNTELKNGVISMNVEVKLCTDVFATCLPPIDLFHAVKFRLGTSCKRKRSAILGYTENKEQILEMALPTFISELGEYMLLDKKVTRVLEDVRETVLKQLMKELADKLGEVEKEFKNKIDFCISGNIPVPPLDLPFFNLRQYFFAGPVPLSLGFGAGGSIGVGIKVGFCIVSLTTQLTLTPWVGGKVWGDAAVDLFFARGGIRLIGYLMETRFPMTIELVFSKFPIDVGAKMDLVLIPLRLQLKAFAEVCFWKCVTVFNAVLWEYSVPEIRKNIFNKKKRDDDPSPPAVLPNTINKRRKRSGTRGCKVQQVFGRPYYDPAFTIEMHAEDEVSEVKMFYAIGTHRGGKNIIDWTEMGGSYLLVPSKLPGGIPLYWSVKAQNSQNLSSISQCYLNTYDSTLPDGRIEHPYKFSSHPNKIIASVVAFEDSSLVETHYKAVGFSPGQYGSQFIDWQILRLDHSATRSGVTGALKQFTIAREGKLVAWILNSQNTSDAETCAQACISYGSNCISFDYEHHSETCDLHDVVQGANAYLRISGTYSNYERLGSGYHTPIEYSGLPLTHGSTYFVNAKVTNVLGYNAYLVGEGTMVDFTPPEPGIIRNARQDILRADKCNAAVTQQCIDVTWKNNHRIIIDGEGSGTVFNGHKPMLDELYSLTNYYVSANWKGFHDDESGLMGFTWAVGRNVCSTDVVAYNDPYAHLTSKKFWTDSGFHKGIHLEDGPYFVTVQALNGAELGGSLVTTVCHSTPFIVDTTPPVFNGVTDIIYDEDFDLIAIYYNATDDLSKISDAEFGLGKTKYDVQLKPYSLHASMERDDPFVAVKELGLQEGIPAWIRIRVTNNVELFTAGHGDDPIMIDRSAPIAGDVLDGDRLRKDRAFQADDDKICAQWIYFFDPESGIDRFLWGVGSKRGDDNIVKFHNLTRYQKSACTNASLTHNRTYYSTVFAFNNALNSKSANSSSDGVLVDVTNPIAGHVNDGKANEEELNFSSETVSKYVNWDGYFDQESGIDHYKVDVFVNNEKRGTFDAVKATEFEDHTISMEHLDTVTLTVHGVNGADLENASESNGFEVDLTPPVLKEIADNDKALAYQSDNSRMNVIFEFQDPESGIKEYRVIIYESRYGFKQKFWPKANHYNISYPSSSFITKMSQSIDGLLMKDGATYSLHVTALNRALLASSHESNGVTVDTTPPQEPKVHIGLLKDEEELDEDGNVLHNDKHGIRVSWSGRDSESGIKSYQVAMGTTLSDQKSILNFTDYGVETTAYIRNIFLQISKESGIRYVVYVRAKNGVGLYSSIGKSKPIFVQKANVAGTVFDGRSLFQDEMFTTDFTSIAASFYGFESDSCNILSYDWAIGTSEYGTDIQTYTTYGLVMLNETHGQCQIHITLIEDTKYFVTVRAITGCQDKYILSSSDGITLDTIPPQVIFDIENSNDTTVSYFKSIIYQDSTDTISVSSNVTDTHSLFSVEWALGTLPLLDDRHPFTRDFSKLTSVVTLSPGEATFITTISSDKAGNINLTSSFAIIADETAPLIENFDCTKYISERKTLLTCTWKTIDEHESQIDEIFVSLESNGTSSDLLERFTVQKIFRSFTKDLNDHVKLIQNMTSLYVNVKVKNIVGQIKTYGKKVVIDHTNPKVAHLAVVTNIGSKTVSDHQKCQLTRQFVELRPYGIADDESGIDYSRFEVSVGLAPYATDVLDYTPVEYRDNDIIFVDGLTLNEGTIFYATLRVYNNAGLKTEVTSESVVISQSPILSVSDGAQDNDIDYQSMPNLLQGKWKYSDPCPIKEAMWSATDLTGKVLFDFQSIPSESQIFYNDEVALENGMKYIVTVKTVDFLGRTKVGHSDGVSVRIQPPLPGMVRDGLSEDLNYQLSTTELSANWDDFGDGSNDPTQVIHHYKVSIGNDRRYEKTKSNIHFFVNVGVNTSFTFKSLNLTSKLVKYYVTVRSYNMAGGYTEGYSNGIRVGFDDDISPGILSVNSYQSSTKSVEVSWTGFRSDIDIIDYKIGISSHYNLITNDTISCSMFYQNSIEYDIYGLSSVNINEYKKVSGLNLKHGDKYFITIIAEDEAGMCIGITSDQILVDTSPPHKGSLYINNIHDENVLFANSDTDLRVKWTDFGDKESGVKTIEVSLLECNTCKNEQEFTLDCDPIAVNEVENDDKTAFYELELSSQKVYHINMSITNGAKLLTIFLSVPILIDTSCPLSGKVKIAKNWQYLDTFQHSTSELHGILAIATTSDDYKCPSQKHFFPEDHDTEFHVLSEDLSSDFVIVNRSGAFLGIGYNADLSEITKSKIVSKSLPLERGNYSITAKIARGENMITTVAFITDKIAIPFIIEEKPVEVHFDERIFENITGLQIPKSNFTDTNRTTILSTTTRKPSSFVPSNDSESSNDTNFATDEYGFGVHFLGYKVGQNKYWHHLFWARNKITSIERWFSLPFDFSANYHKFTINVDKKSEYLETTLDLTLIIDDEEIINIAGFKFFGDMKMTVLTWNENGYKPPITDIYKPFYSEAVIRRIDIPDENDKLCRHGRGFYDGESGIKEIWLGVSDSKFKFGNLLPLSLYRQYCYHCQGLCTTLCQQPCSHEILQDGFELISLDLKGLDMKFSSINDSCRNITSDIQCNSTSYYINVKIVNYAGLESIAYSNAIQIDLTPPECDYVKCLDPDYSEDEPTQHLGSSSTIGAYWECYEDIGQIQSYFVRIFDFSNNETVMNSTSVGLKTKTVFKLENGTFKDDTNYIVEVTSLNTAGLSVKKTCQVQVNLFPPDTSGAATLPLYTTATNVSGDEDSPYWTTSQTEIGIEWEGGNSKIEYYEWQIGTSENGQDVFPPVKVGQNETGSSAIVHGKLEFDRKEINKSVAEFRNITAMKPEEILNISKKSETEKAFFNMEPGRCVHQSLYAIGYSHLRSKIQGITVCVKRMNDVYLRGTHRKTVSSKSKSSDKWSADVVSLPEIVVDANLITGGLSLGTLSKDDLSDDYGSAATTDYKPFIKDPETSLDKTTRLLRNRIKKLCNVSFFVSPAPLVEYEQIRVNITVPNGCEKDPDNQPALISWDSVKQQWVHVDEGCRDHLTAIVSSDTYTSEICKGSIETSSLTKRTTTSTFSSPRTFVLSQISRKFPNNPPTIITDSFELFEDCLSELHIKTVDIENDTLEYEIKKHPSNLLCDIHRTRGVLNCTCYEDFNGEDTITVRVTETGLPEFEEALSDERTISLIILGVPDKTDRYYIDSNGSIYSDTRPSMTKTFILEANQSSSFDAGQILLADADEGEVFEVNERYISLGNSTYTLVKANISSNTLKNITSIVYRSFQSYDIHFEFSPEVNGNMSFQFIAKLADGSFTPSVTIELFILNNPCVYGHCSPLGSVGCDDILRSISFADFQCSCYPGYEGQWCQTETNECQWEPCALMFDCEDLINEYKCNINIPKLMAILICSILAIGGASFVVLKLINRIRSYKEYKIKSNTFNLKSSKVSESFEMYGQQPSTSTSIFQAGSAFLEDAINDHILLTSFTGAPVAEQLPYQALSQKGSKSTPSPTPDKLNLQLSDPTETLETKSKITLLRSDAQLSSQLLFETHEEPTKVDD